MPLLFIWNLIDCLTSFGNLNLFYLLLFCLLSKLRICSWNLFINLIPNCSSVCLPDVWLRIWSLCPSLEFDPYLVHPDKSNSVERQHSFPLRAIISDHNQKEIKGIWTDQSQTDASSFTGIFLYYKTASWHVKCPFVLFKSVVLQIKVHFLQQKIKHF